MDSAARLSGQRARGQSNESWVSSVTQHSQYASSAGRRMSKIDTTTVDTMMDGGLDKFYAKLNRHHGKEYAFDVDFKDLAFSANLKVRDPETMMTWLTAPFRRVTGGSKTEKKTVLHPMTGTIPAGSLTLLIGGPGSGKTTLLKILSGMIPAAKAAGSHVHINGTDIRKVANTTRHIGMVPQADNHHPTLTVKETLEFACHCHLGYNDCRLDELRAEFIMKLLGIDHRADTIVGSAAAGIRGISGGERKRVTIGECLVGEQGFVLMDEMNTGLDSQATLDVVKSMRSWCDVLGGTCVISMLQPQSDVLEVFDRIMLINDGRMVYNGPINELLDHFAKIHLEPAEHHSVTDWALEDICGHPDPDMLARFYHSQVAAATILEEDEEGASDCGSIDSIDTAFDSELLQETIDISNKNPFALSFASDFKLLFCRQWKLTIRNRILNYSMLAEALLVSLLLGLAFFDIQEPTLVMALLFALASLLTRQSWQVIPIVLADRSIFYKQRALNMHRTSTYVLAMAIAQFPVNLFTVFLLITPLYFLANLAGSTFVTCVITGFVLLVLQQALRGWMTCFAAISPNANVAQATSAIFLCGALLFSGFIILEGLIPSWAIWMYWISPISWGIRALAQVEFLSDYWEDARGISNVITGKEALQMYQFSTDSNFIWYGCIMLFSQFLICALFFSYLGFQYVRPAQNYAFRLKETKEIEVDLLVDSIPALHRKGPNEGEAVVKVDVETTPVDSHAIPIGEKFKPAALTIRNLRYSVPGPKKGETIELLQGVTAHFPAGTLTCLMGSSGAGKTTLMDVIAGRKTGGTITGDIAVNGEKMDKVTFSRMIGYCEQFDSQSPTLSVWESLLFSSKLRRTADGISHDTWCMKQLMLLEMEDIMYRRIGGLGIEQRKRLSIAQELCANPSILFLDEPTSGLDAQGALLVINAIKAVAQSGRTVFCTIHQPSTDLFQ
mmetsp:Transcript_6147/g.10516  ORF Transcript_6147/g.10516 Transcript_6147/m.10516 type:complete len:956 (+) Transcript_6147:299-3166(+)